MEQQIQDLIASIKKDGIESATMKAKRFWKKPVKRLKELSTKQRKKETK